jgi:hypothetical protein
MRDLEAEMAKALEGQFFWEHTATPDEQTSGDSRSIIVAQRKFFQPKVKTPEECRSEDLARLQEVIARKKPETMQYNTVSTCNPKDLRNFASSLAVAIADVYDLEVSEIVGKIRGIRSAFAKHHYPWAMIRYFPLVSMRTIATAVGKDRATVYHSDQRFTENQHGLEGKIAAVDAIVGYRQ